MAFTITSASATVSISVPDVFSSPFTLQGFAADDAFSNEDVSPAQAVMGVDGLMSAGFTPFMTPFKFMLMPDSPSIEFMDQWLGAMSTALEVFYANCNIQLPSVGKSYALIKGALTGTRQFPDAKKVLDPVSYTITFESVLPAPLGF